MNRVIFGDCRDTMRDLRAQGVRVQCCVTSPPYYGLRDYGHPGQIGLEKTPAEYVAALVEVFEGVRELLADDGVLWLNLGDSYNAAGREGHGTRQGYKQGSNRASASAADNCRPSVADLKPKDLIGIPWRVAFALQAAGWYLRQDVIWHKPNPMPESVTDRCTKAHEYVFLLSKSERYFYDLAAMQEPAVGTNEHDLTGRTKQRLAGNVNPPKGQAAYEAGDDLQRTKAGLLAYAQRQRAKVSDDRKDLRTDTESRHRSSIPGGQSMQAEPTGMRNKRSVWTIATQPFSEAHFATMAPELAETCIKAGCPEGGTVLDPFGGAGTTGLVADRLQRSAVLCELNPEYIAIAQRRIAADAPLFASVEVHHA